MSDDNKIHLYGVIGWDVDAKSVAIHLHNNRDKPVTVHIHSPGGYTSDAKAIMSAMRQHGNVHVHIDGLAASAATMIMLAAAKVTASPGADIMIHAPWMTLAGEADDLRKAADLLDKEEARMVADYVAKTGLTTEEITALVKEETWMTAAEALEYGFIDGILDHDVELDVEASISDYLTLALGEDGLPRYTNPAAKQRGRIAATLKSVRNNHGVEMDELKEKEVRAAAELAVKQEEQRKAQATLAAERERYTAISALCARHNVPEHMKANFIDAGLSVEAVQANILTFISHTVDAVSPNIKVGESGAVALERDTMNAIEARAGLAERDPQNNLHGQSLATLALRFDPERGKGGTMAMLERVFRARGSVDAGIGHSTSDFPALLSNVAEKAMLKGYSLEPFTHELWSSKGQVSSFMPAQRSGLGNFPDLEEVAEGAQYVGTTLSENSAQVQVATFGRTFGITRQAIINDDLGAFTKIPEKFGRAARRTVENRMYDLLNSNVLVQDGTALFTVAHANGASTALAEASLAAGIAAMKNQTDPDGENANLAPRFLIVPPDLEYVARQILNPNDDTKVLAGQLELIVSSKLSSSAAWFLVADPAIADTAEATYLFGNDQPYLAEQEGFTVDGRMYKVRLDFGTSVLDFRPFYRGGAAIS